MENVHISVSKIPGGFVVSLGNGEFIETSLNKVISKIKEALTPAVELLIDKQ
jgi:hypothetical protein